MELDLEPKGFFQEKTVPAGTRLGGRSALVDSLGVAAPVRRPSCVSDQYIGDSKRQQGDWVVFDKRYQPGDTFADQLTFALKHEDLDLLVLKRIFAAIPKSEMEEFVRAVPTGSPTRRCRSM